MAKLAGQQATISFEPDNSPPVGTDCAPAIDMTKVCRFDPDFSSYL